MELRILVPRKTVGLSGDGGPAARAQLNGPRGVAVDGRGNVYIADSGNHRAANGSALTERADPAFWHRRTATL